MRERNFKHLNDEQLQAAIARAADKTAMRIELLGRQSHDRERRLEQIYGAEWLAEMEGAH